jgi:hypothetical protein
VKPAGRDLRGRKKPAFERPVLPPTWVKSRVTGPGHDRRRFGSCPSSQAIDDYLEGRVDPRETGRIEAHIGACAACRELIAVLVRVDPRVDLERH